MNKKIRQAIGWIIIGLLVVVAFVLLMAFQAWILWGTWNNGIAPMFDLPEVKFMTPLTTFWGAAFTVSTWKLLWSDWNFKSVKKNKGSK